MVPTLQLYVNPIWNRQDLAQGTQLRSCSKSWRHEVPDDLRVEGISRDAHSRITDDAARGSIPANGGANVNQREIARTAPEIPNEDKLVVIERGFVIICRCYGLHLELHGFVASRAEGRSKSILRINVIFWPVCPHKMNWPSGYGRPDVDPKLIFRHLSKISENPCDQIFKRVPSTENLRAVETTTA